MANLLLIGGPNGAGKSTVAPALIREILGQAPFVNADVIARGIAGRRADDAAFEAGRLAITRIRELIAAGEDFAFESTLSSRSLARWLGDAKGGGYTVFLAYVWVPGADMATRRVAQRAASGGHDVPPEIVRRRYERSVVNFRDIYLPLADQWIVLRATDDGFPPTIARGQRGRSPEVYDEAAWDAILGRRMLREAVTPYLAAASPKPDRIDEAIRVASGEALLKHKLLRQSVVTCDREGNVRDVPPDEIDTGLSPDEEAEAIATAGHGTWFSQ